MAWTAPRTWAAEVLTSTLLNTHLRDNLNWLHDEGGWVWVGGSTTEQTTATGSSVDLVTISSLSIVVGRPVAVHFNFRKGAGAAAAAGFGLKVNATTVYDGASGGTYVAVTSATNRAEDGNCSILILPRSTSYLAGVVSARHECYPSTGGAPATSSAVTPTTQTALIPNATITSLIIRANSGSSSITAAVKDVHVFVLGVDGS